MPAAAKKGPDLTIVFGKGPSKGGPKPGKHEMPDGEMMDDAEMPAEGDDYSAEFSAGVLEAFPDLSEDQVAALKRAVESCVESKLGG